MLLSSEPYYKTDFVTLYCGDALEILEELPEESVDLVITSPPYNVGREYGERVDDLKRYEEYLSFAKEWLSKCYRLLKFGGRIAVNVPSCLQQSKRSKSAYLAIDYVLLMREIGFLDMEWIGWVKSVDGSSIKNDTAWGSWCSPTHPYLRDIMEYVIVMAKGSKKRKDRKGKNDITAEEFKKFTTNVWYIPPVSCKEHPAVFPEELVYRLVKLYTWEGDVVLDPFVGSGTTLVVCEKTKRRGIGVEIEEKFCELVVKRLVFG